MAKSAPAMAMKMDKPEPVVHISWPRDAKGGDVKVADDGALAMGKKVRVVVEGEVRGHSMADYGCSIDVKPSGAISVAGLGGEGESLADMLTKNRAKGKRKKSTNDDDGDEGS